MAKFTFSKDQLDGSKPLPAGVYDLRCDGLKPRSSKDKKSVNFNPQLKVINSTTHNDEKVWFNMNSGAAFIIRDFIHSCGLTLPGEESSDSEVDVQIPGDFVGLDQFPNDPEKWNYLGPLVGATCQVELIETTYNNKPKNDFKRFVCKVPGCTQRHSDNLIKSDR